MAPWLSDSAIPILRLCQDYAAIRQTRSAGKIHFPKTPRYSPPKTDQCIHLPDREKRRQSQYTPVENSPKRVSKHIHPVANQREPTLQHFAPPIQLSAIIPPNILKRNDSPPTDLARRVHDNPALLLAATSERVDEQEMRLEDGPVVEVATTVRTVPVNKIVGLVVVETAAEAKTVLQPLQTLVEDGCGAAEVVAADAPGVENSVVAGDAGAVVG